MVNIVSKEFEGVFCESIGYVVSAKIPFALLMLATILLCTLSLSVAAEESWRTNARERIERIRKGDLMVRVVDVHGTPLPDVPVQVVMERHAFPWGTCVTARHIMGAEPDDALYRAKLLELFNCAVLENDLKWNAWNGAWGAGYDRDRTRAALVWLKEHRFRIRGHCLVHPGWKYCRPDGEELREDLPALRKRILEHIDELAAFTRDHVAEWDVINEPVHENEIIQALGEDSMTEWLSRARMALPESCRLFINEYNIVEPDDPSARTRYEAIITTLLNADAPLEGIGFQGHFHEPPATPEDALQVFDTFARFGLPIVVTEFDVNSQDESGQASFTRDFMTSAFSHPACSGFLFWGFWEGAHWRPDGAMFRQDWSGKPNLAAYRELVFKEWWTEIQDVTGKDGILPVRGFKGDYRITVGGRHQNVTIDDVPITVEFVFENELP